MGSHPDEKPLFSCEVCAHDFEEKSDAQKHALETHASEGDLPKCTACSFQGTAEETLLSHMDKHIVQNPRFCPTCSKQFDEQESLNQHISEVHSPKENKLEYLVEEQEPSKDKQELSKGKPEIKERKHECPTCYRNFKTKHHLDRHILIHTGEKPFQCPVCAKRLSRANIMRKHMLRHTQGDKVCPYLCPRCAGAFETKSAFQLHVKRKHSSEPGLATLHVVPTKAELRRQLTAYAKENPFQCNQCGIRFPSKISVELHSKCHDNSNGAAFNCKVCNLECKSKRALKLHKLTHSEQATTLTGRRGRPRAAAHTVVTKATKASSRRKKIVANVQARRGRPKKQPIGDSKEVLDSAQEQENPLGTEGVTLEENGMFSCKGCNGVTSSESGLFEHSPSCSVRAEQETIFSCEVCSKPFTAWRNMQRHFKMVHDRKASSRCKPATQNFALLTKYRCSFCVASFSQGGALNRHIANIHRFARTEASGVEQTIPSSESQGNMEVSEIKPPVAEKLPSQTPNLPKKLSNRQRQLRKKLSNQRPQLRQRSSTQLQQSLKRSRVIGVRGKVLKSYACHFCSKVFPTPSKLQRHLDGLQHSQETSTFLKAPRSAIKTAASAGITLTPGRKFACGSCVSTFTQKYSLNRHVAKLHGGKNYTPPSINTERLPCPYCECSYTQRGSLNRHIGTVHGSKKIPRQKVSQQKVPPQKISQRKVSPPKADVASAEETEVVPQRKPRKGVGRVGKRRGTKSKPRQKKTRSCSVDLAPISPNNVFVCKFCELTFEAKVDLIRHITKHARQEAIATPGRTQRALSSLESATSGMEHASSSTSMVPSGDRTILKDPKTLLAASSDACPSSPQRKYPCTECSLSFHWRINMRRHHRDVHAPKYELDDDPKDDVDLPKYNMDDDENSKASSDTNNNDDVAMQTVDVGDVETNMDTVEQCAVGGDKLEATAVVSMSSHPDVAKAEPMTEVDAGATSDVVMDTLPADHGAQTENSECSTSHQVSDVPVVSQLTDHVKFEKQETLEKDSIRNDEALVENQSTEPGQVSKAADTEEPLALGHSPETEVACDKSLRSSQSPEKDPGLKLFQSPESNPGVKGHMSSQSVENNHEVKGHMPSHFPEGDTEVKGRRPSQSPESDPGGEGVFPCTVCDLSFTSIGRLKRHMNFHISQSSPPDKQDAVNTVDP